MSVCGDVAEYKIGTGKAVYDAAREAQKIAAVQELAHSEFNKEAVKEIFSQLMSVSRRYQYSLLSAHGMEWTPDLRKWRPSGRRIKRSSSRASRALQPCRREVIFRRGRGSLPCSGVRGHDARGGRGTR
ncbi:MAG: chorismate mutase [Pilosibacter sp.]